MFALIARSVLAPLMRLVYRPVVEGRENVPKRGAVILASNHLSFIDSVVIPLVAPRPVVFLAKAEYFTGTGFKGWLSRSFFTAIDAVPVERGTHRAAQASLDAALEALNEGNAFGIYPEGKRSLDGRLYRGKPGVAWLALTSGALVVPVALAGTEKVQPVGKRLPRIRRITVKFGEPMDFGDRAVAVRERAMAVGPARRAVTEEIMEAIQKLSQQELANVYNEGQVTAESS
ncbi:lysophospholipid acyltransferase family protein [Streptacidiphilus albus]|uniref:lysophospholipid acyltransferase family protein n=1 Tax=Streptacidiphilus albus TaxID=105425 RepID=UPI00054C6D37|nr:lysophospholipid acyltransferase family protein [Streptacidiphilus albus]